MKHKLLMGIMPAILCASALLAVSCQEKPAADKTVKANVSGLVIDDQENPLEGVTVSFVSADAKREVKATATTGSDGKFVANDVPSTGRLVNFTKEGYASANTTIAEASFATGAIELETVTLIFSEASIEGSVFTLSGDPYPGATVKCNEATATTDEDGSYKFEGLTIKDYTLEFSDTEGNVASLEIAAADFIDGIAYAKNVTLGSYVIPGLTYNEFISAPYWYGNDFAGGTGTFKMQWNHVGFLTAYPYKQDGYRNAAEGISLVSFGNSEGELSNYLYGRKQIYEGNCWVNLCARNFRATASTPAKLGIGVIDLSENTRKITYLPAQDIYPGLKKMGGGTKTLDVEHNHFAFDLSAYAGKEIAFAIGVFGGYVREDETVGYPETPIVRILFADKDMTTEFDNSDLSATFTGEKPEGCDWDGFTKANLSSLTPLTTYSFTGQSLGAENGNFVKWAGTNHIAMNWAYLVKDESMAPLQDDSIFAIAAHNNNINKATMWIAARYKDGPKKNMTLKCRTYGANPTYFRVSVYDISTQAITALAPTNTDGEAIGLSSGDNGTIGLKHDSGTVNDPSGFATLTFDLSSYAGKDVDVIISNHKGNNLSIYSIDFAD